jgi:hypothetical protein
LAAYWRVFFAAALAWYITIPVLLWKIMKELRRIR